MEGRMEGRLEGKMEGKLEEQLRIARNMKSAGIAADAIAAVTGLPMDEVEKL